MASQIRGLIRFSMGLLVGLAVLLSAGCGSDAASDAPVGELALTLSATSPLGVDYQLRDALFLIRGPQDEDVSSEDYPPEQSVIELSLASGSYQVTLQDGWRMEYSANGQAYSPIEAMLVSPNPADVTVVFDQVTPLTLVFAVNGTMINFGPGTLGIAIEVNEILLSIDLSSSALPIGGPEVGYTGTVVNPNGELPSVGVQTSIDQGATSCLGGGTIVHCEGAAFPALAPGTCAFNDAIQARNSSCTGGTLVPGPATARFELSLASRDSLDIRMPLDEVQIPVTLVAAPPSDCRTNGIGCSGLTYCDPSTGVCMPGCANDTQCPGANESCHVPTHACVCDVGFERCNLECVDTLTDERNCGSCGIACGSGELCVAGVCFE